VGIEYHIGDATEPVPGEDEAFIIHICNNRNTWGAGFVMALSKRWDLPERRYRMGKGTDSKTLGMIQPVLVESSERFITVINMIAQDNHRSTYPLVDYDALAVCLANVVTYIQSLDAASSTIHCPRIGCGIGGGRWEVIESMLKVVGGFYPVHVYDLP
jgi:O-acetyl-ADP-ribose deacetylase (regulator of RNase III)